MECSTRENRILDRGEPQVVVSGGCWGLGVVAVRRVGEQAPYMLEVLADPEFVKSTMPFVVGRQDDEVTLMFSRLLFRFQDTYRVRVEGGSTQGFVRHVLEGRRSTIVFEYRVEDDNVVVEAEYKGPRGWVVSSKLGRLASSLLDDAMRMVEKTRVSGGATGDYSRMLASIAWTSKLLMKSILLKNELVIIPKGGLMGYVESLIGEGVIGKYRVVYVSGTGDKGSFRLLFVDGRLSGVYAVIEGKEHIGNDRVLNEYEGVTRVKVYGSVARPEEVLHT